MLRAQTLPGSVQRLLEVFRPCFTAPTFQTFVALTLGLIAAPAGRTVCGMLAAAGLAAVWHHSRAHRFFSTARWSVDQVGLGVLRLVVGWMVPADAPVLIAIDDTLFRRRGRTVHAACWAYDGSLPTPKKGKRLSYGNTFVVAAAVVTPPFLTRPVALPVACRLWRPGGPTKTTMAHELINMIAGACPGRIIHVVADGAYACAELRHLPSRVTLTTLLPRHAALWQVHPELDDPSLMQGRRGRPRVRGAKIGTPDRLRRGRGTRMSVTRYGRTATITVHERRCLWYGVFRAHPVRVIVVPDRSRSWLALVTTDPSTPAGQIIERYAARWAIEVAFHDAKNNTGAGEARNRTARAVARTVPFALFTQSLVIIWYYLAGHHPSVVRDRRAQARWYTTKRCPAYGDMLVKLRRVLIAAQYLPGVAHRPTPEEVRAVQLAWAQAGT
jgi:hypothetical protein